jgi:hypothetical protein
LVSTLVMWNSWLNWMVRVPLPVGNYEILSCYYSYNV